MIEPEDRIEAELARMRPHPMPADLTERLDACLSAPEPASPWPDRFLVSAMAAGALAACVIIGVLLTVATDSAPVMAPTAQITNVPRIGTPLQSLAQLDVNWAEAR